MPPPRRRGLQNWAVPPGASHASLRLAFVCQGQSASVRNNGATSDDLEELQLALHHLHVAEAATQDVADLGEVARTRYTLVIDVLARGQHRQALQGAIDLLAATLADLANVVLERAAGGLLSLGHCEN